ncbi:hypothetical protein AWB67_07470 [Caballeronia terrestris]|uniref:Uncharacterized protein n=1 Tax=Caballeronia terrestris TaxID=1226301 RepID=A0A158L2X7_9BURK|nr:hypothetical protein AWB67_07470 [Caballeronia terrestris]
MPGAQGVLEVNLRAVVFSNGRLDPAFCHHGIAVAQAQLGSEDHSRALIRRGERRSASAAAADDQHIGTHELRAGDVDIVDQPIRLKVARKIRLTGLVAVHSDGQCNVRVGPVVGVIALHEFIDGGLIAAYRGDCAATVALVRVLIRNSGGHDLSPLSARRLRAGRIEINLHLAVFDLL